MEAVCSSETLVTTYQSIWHHNPEDYNTVVWVEEEEEEEEEEV
jgi:hypothetical protein